MGPLAIESLKITSIYYLQAAVIWAHIGIFASLIVGLFGGYWIKFLRWNDVDYIGIYSVDYQGIYDANNIFFFIKIEK